MNEKKYWTGTVGPLDDFNEIIVDVFYDGATYRGPWAIMTPYSWMRHGCGIVGQGAAQRYEKQEDGKWMKKEG